MTTATVRPFPSSADPEGMPDYPRDVPLIVYDGHCGMCSLLVRIVLRADGDRVRHRFAPSQSALGESLYRRFGHPGSADATMLLVDGETCRTKADAALAVLESLGPAWGLVSRALRIVPPGWLDRAYDVVARVRYRVWGRLDACRRPPPGTEARFLA